MSLAGLDISCTVACRARHLGSALAVLPVFAGLGSAPLHAAFACAGNNFFPLACGAYRSGFLCHDRLLGCVVFLHPATGESRRRGQFSSACRAEYSCTCCCFMLHPSITGLPGCFRKQVRRRFSLQRVILIKPFYINLLI
jgi:hypothetical protein